MPNNFKQVVYWGVGALALFALAGPSPDIATGLAVLLIVGVLLTHYQDYLALFTGGGGGSGQAPATGPGPGTNGNLQQGGS